METNWDNIAWMFSPYHGYKQIFLQEATLADWTKLINFLNENYRVVFSKYKSGEIDTYEITNQIDREIVFQWLNDSTGKNGYGDAAINLNGLEINCYFEFKDQIQLSFDSTDVKSIVDYKKVEELMVKLGTLFDKQVTLAEEGEPEFPLIKVDVTREIIEVVDKKKYDNRYNSLKYRIEYLHLRFLRIFSPKKYKIMMDKRDDDDDLPKKIQDNAW
jgi:hypothetical protein